MTSGRSTLFFSLGLTLATPLVVPLGCQSRLDSSVVSVRGSGPTAYVLISGIVGGVAGFRRLSEHLLRDGARVVVIDPYRLSLDSADVTFTALARRTDAVLGELGVDSAQVVGHAHGGGVALRLAANAPHRVAALYLLDVGALPVNRTKVFSRALWLAPIIDRIPGGRRFLRGQFYKGIRQNSGTLDWFDPSTQMAYSEPLLDRIGDAVEMAERLARAEEPEPVEDVVGRIRVPVMLILGDVPRPAGPDSTELTVLRPVGNLVQVQQLSRVGHFPHEEAPAAVARYVRKAAAVSRAGTLGPDPGAQAGARSPSSKRSE